MRNTLMTLEQVAVQRNGQNLFEDLNCHIKAGEITVVLGANGVGKSSLLLAMAGLIPVVGKLDIQGRRLQDYSRENLSEQVAWLGSLPPTEFGLTVKQRFNMVQANSDAEITDISACMDIQHLLSRPLGELSSGERQRVELVALMLRDVPIWLLDEPTSHLDLKHQIQCMMMLQKQRQQQRAMVVVLHDLQQAAAIANQVIFVQGNKRICCGSAQDMLTEERLHTLFDAPLISIQNGHANATILPDYTQKNTDSGEQYGNQT